jgi:hypothetical protein
MRCALLISILFICTYSTNAQQSSGDLDLEISFQTGQFGDSPYKQGDVYLHCYAWDNVPISWGIGTGFRDGMSYQHFHSTLGPVLGVMGFAAGISPTETAVYPGGYDEFGNPDSEGHYDYYGNYIGVEYEEERGSFFGGLLLGILGLIVPEKIGVDLNVSKHLTLQPYARVLGMHVARINRQRKPGIRYNYGLGAEALLKFPNSEMRFAASAEFQGLTRIGAGVFYGGHIFFPLNY